jgi:phosphoribosylformylglycinamidine (FGAM) synthase PurS component
MTVAAPDADEARAQARRMCDKLLANPVTEDYELEIGT